ncbi:ATP-binding protein [Catenulispora yoronensis]
MQLYERHEVLDAVGADLARAARGAGGVTVVLGSPGIGKTRLAAEIAARARAAGMTVLSARGHELEQDLPFGVVLQLLEPALADGVAGSVAGSAHAERAAMFAGDASGAQTVFEPGSASVLTDPASVVHALYRLTLRLSARSPLALLVDDAHWADAPSLRWLNYLARRSDRAAVLSVVLSRSQEPGPAQPLVEALAQAQAARTVVLRPLTRTAVAALLLSALGPSSERFVDACRHATGGNPFLLTELIRHLAQSPTQAIDSDAAELAPIVPETISRWVLARVNRLGPQTLAVVRAAAVLGEHGRLDQVASLAGLSTSNAADACDLARAAGILAPSAAFAFSHPLVAGAIRADIPTSARGLMHRRAARMLARSGAAAPQIAAHLLAAPPIGDAWTVARLRKAADRALAAGAPEIAAEYLRRAAEEPPPPQLRGQVHHEWGIAASHLDPRSALPLFQLAVEQSTDRHARCEAALGLAKAFSHCDQVGSAVAVLDATAATIGHPGDTRRLRVEQSVWSAWWAGHADPGGRRALLECLGGSGSGDGRGAGSGGSSGGGAGGDEVAGASGRRIGGGGGDRGGDGSAGGEGDGADGRSIGGGGSSADGGARTGASGGDKSGRTRAGERGIGGGGAGAGASNGGGDEGGHAGAGERCIDAGGGGSGGAAGGGARSVVGAAGRDEAGRASSGTGGRCIGGESGAGYRIEHGGGSGGADRGGGNARDVRTVLVLRAWEAMIAGDPVAEVCGAVERAVAVGADWASEGHDFENPCILAQVYIFTDRLDAATALLDRGSRISIGMVGVGRTTASCRLCVLSPPIGGAICWRLSVMPGRRGGLLPSWVRGCRRGGGRWGP